MGLRERVYFPSFVLVISIENQKKKGNQKIMADIVNDKCILHTILRII